MREAESAEEELARRERLPPPKLKMVLEESRERGFSRRPMVFQLRMKLLLFM